MDTITQKKAAGVHVETVLGKLWVQQTGDGAKTILLWPSIFTDHHIFDRLATRLALNHKVLTIDGPGHGQSPGVLDEFSMSDCADAIIDILDAHGIGKAIIGGTSWGGLAVAEVALAYPDRVETIILMNTPMRIDRDKPGMSARLIAFGARWMLGTRMFRNGIARSFFRAESLEHNPAYATAFHKMLSSANRRNLAAAIRSVILCGKPLIDRIDRIAMPLLIISGKDDEMYPLHTQAEAALRTSHGVFEPVSGKHISAIDAPDEVAEAVIRFLTNEVAA